MNYPPQITNRFANEEQAEAAHYLMLESKGQLIPQHQNPQGLTEEHLAQLWAEADYQAQALEEWNNYYQD